MLGNIFALPGDQADLFPSAPVECHNVGSTETNQNAGDLTRATMCVGFSESQIKEMCDCHKSVHGDAVRTSDEYKAFEQDLQSFDAQVSAKMEFVSDPDVLKIATMMNLLASGDNTIKPPFGDDGSCSLQFKAMEQATHTKLASIPLVLRNETNYNYLEAEGLSATSLKGRISTLFTKSDEELDSVDRVLRESFELSPSLSSEELHSISGTSAGINYTIEALCTNLALSLFQEFEKGNVESPIGRFVDRETNLSKKTLNETDIEAYLGLRHEYMSSQEIENPMHETYFNEKFCSQFDFQTLEEPKGTTESEIKALSDDELKENILNLTAFLEKNDDETRAATISYQRAQDEYETLEQDLLNAAKGLGLSEEKFKDFLKEYNRLTAVERPALLENFLRAEFPDRNLQEIPGLDTLRGSLAIYSNAKGRYDQLLAIYSQSIGLQAEKIFELDETFTELAFRKGGFREASDFVGINNLRSRSFQYYSKIHEISGDDRTQGISPLQEVRAIVGAGQANAARLAGVIRESLDLSKRFSEVASQIIRSDAQSDYFDDEQREDRRKALEFTGLGYREGTRNLGISSGRKESRREFLRQIGDTSSLDSNVVSQSFFDRTESVKGGFSQDPPPTGSGSLEVTKAAGTTSAIEDTRALKIAGEQSLMVRSDPSSFAERQMAMAKQIARDQEFATSLATSSFDANNSIIENSIESSMNRIDQRINSLEKSESPLSEEEKQLEEQLKTLRAELEGLRKRNEDLNRRRDTVVGPAATATATPTPSVRNLPSEPVIADGFSGGGSGSGSRRTERSDGGAARGPAAVTSGGSQPVIRDSGISDGGGGSIRAEGDVARGPTSIGRTGRAISRSTSPDGDSGVELTLVSRDLGFAVIDAPTEGASLKPTNVDFLSLPIQEKLRFMEEFFQGREEDVAYIKQVDGRVVLLEKNKGFNVVEEPEPTSILVSAEVSEQQEIIYRLNQLDELLDQAKN